MQVKSMSAEDVCATAELCHTQKPEVTVFYEPETHTVCSVVRDPSSYKVAVIDSVMGFDFSSGNTNTADGDQVIEWIQSQNLEVQWILETHAHADHLSAAPYIQEKLGGKIAIGENICLVQDMFAGVFNLGPSFPKDGSQFDKLFADGETFQIGELNASVIYTPGHTPACVCSLVLLLEVVSGQHSLQSFRITRLQSLAPVL